MIELKCREACEFEFDMQLNGGAVGAAPRVIFCVDISPTWGMTFPCAPGERGVHTVKIPKLGEHNVAPGEYPCRIMVLLGESVFFPYTDIICLKDDPKPVVSTFSKTTSGPTVTMSQPVVAVPTEAEVKPTAAPIAEALKGPAAKDIEAFSTLLRKKT
jgi:hypothetical protein